MTMHYVSFCTDIPVKVVRSAILAAFGLIFHAHSTFAAIEGRVHLSLSGLLPAIASDSARALPLTNISASSSSVVCPCRLFFRAPLLDSRDGLNLSPA